MQSTDKYCPCDSAALALTDMVIHSDAFHLVDGQTEGYISLAAATRLSSIRDIHADYVGAGSLHLQVDVAGSLYYWDGSDWVTSDGTFAQTGDLGSEKLDLLPIAGVQDVNIRLWLHQTDVDGIPPYVPCLTLNYDRTIPQLAVTARTLVYGYYMDILGQPVEGATVRVELEKTYKGKYVEANGNGVMGVGETTTDECGLWQMPLIPSNAFENVVDMLYVFTFTLPNGKVAKTTSDPSGIKVSIPAASSINLSSIISA